LEEDVVRENNIEKASVQDANIISVEIESSNFTGIFDSSDKELFELIDVNDTVVTIKHLDDNKEEKETSFVYFNGDIEPIELHHPFSIENLEDKSYANIIAPSQENDSTNENIIEDKEEIMTKTEEELEVIAEDTKKQKPLLISIYGSPGSGKTTLSFDIASAINKDSDIPSAEYIPEIARLMIMENKDNVKDQLKVSTTQFDLCKNAINTSDIVITDSPIELGLNFMNDAVDSEKQIVNDFINEGREYYRQNTHEVSIFLPIPAKEAFYDKDPNRITSYEQSELIAKKVKKKLDKENRSYVEFDRNKDNLKELIAQIKESWESTIDIDIENTTKAEISEEAKYIKEKVEAEMQKYSIAKNLDIEDSLNTALEKENTYLVAVGGSGSGKTHFASKLPIEKVVNATTREKREGEIEGVDYYYLNNEEFDNLDLLESTTFNGKKYGMPKDELDGKDNGVIVTGPSGVQNIKNYIENTLKAKTILVHFNIDKETRIENMKKRGDSMETIESRLQDDNIDEVVSEQLEVDITIDRLDNAYQRIVSYVLKQDSEVDSKLSDSLDVLIESDLLTKDDKEILLNIANREDVTQNARFTKGESFSLDDKASNKDLVKWLVYSKNLSVDELVTATSRLYQMDIDYSDVGIKVTFAEFKSIVVSDEYALKELLIEVIGNKSESTVEKSSLREILTSYDSIKTEENSSQGLFNLDVDYDRVDELKERIISPSIMQQ
jgi:guanylate kinase